MDAHFHQPEDDLTAIERRLNGWQPNVDGLNADAMLFAAGLAAGRRRTSRLLSPALCAVLAALATGLGFWGLSERAERQSLASRLREPATVESPAINVAVAQRPLYEPTPGDYLSTRRRMEEDLNGFLSSVQPPGLPALGPPPPGPQILTPRPSGDLSVM